MASKPLAGSNRMTAPAAIQTAKNQYESVRYRSGTPTHALANVQLDEKQKKLAQRVEEKRASRRRGSIANVEDHDEEDEDDLGDHSRVAYAAKKAVPDFSRAAANEESLEVTYLVDELQKNDQLATEYRECTLVSRQTAHDFFPVYVEVAATNVPNQANHHYAIVDGLMVPTGKMGSYDTAYTDIIVLPSGLCLSHQPPTFARSSSSTIPSSDPLISSSDVLDGRTIDNTQVTCIARAEMVFAIAIQAQFDTGNETLASAMKHSIKHHCSLDVRMLTGVSATESNEIGIYLIRYKDVFTYVGKTEEGFASRMESHLNDKAERNRVYGLVHANYPNNVDRLAIVPLSQHSSTGQVRDSRIVAALEFQLIVATKASDGMFGCNINVVDAHLNIRKVATSDALLLYENIKLWRADHPDEPFPLSTAVTELMSIAQYKHQIASLDSIRYGRVMQLAIGSKRSKHWARAGMESVLLGKTRSLKAMSKLKNKRAQEQAEENGDDDQQPPKRVKKRKSSIPLRELTYEELLGNGDDIYHPPPLFKN